MPDFLKGLLQGLFGPREEDPMGSITPDQLAIVLKSIEDKFGALQEENLRLRARLDGGRDDRDVLLARIEAQEREIASLKQALTEQSAAEPLVDDIMLRQALAEADEVEADDIPRYSEVLLLAQDLEDDLEDALETEERSRAEGGEREEAVGA